MEEQGAVLQFDLLQRIHAAIAIPLVIHGASGVSDTEIPKLIACGARKVNIGTALRMAFGTTLRELFTQNPGEFDRLKFYPACMEAVRNKAKEKLLVLQQPYDKELKI
jgi:fructose-bisphosphate aldolase class II